MRHEEARRKRRDWMLLGIQLVPLLVMMMTVVACSGGGDIGGLGYDIQSNIFLNGFITNSNDNFPDTSVNPIVTNENIAQQFGPCAALTYPAVNAQLTISNGIGAVIEQIAIEFTETNGQPLVDLSGPVPISRAGEFDFIINTHISIPANPISTSPSAFQEPSGSTTRFFFPIQIYETNIFCEFQVNQPTARPLLAKMTFRGIDVLENRFTFVGFLIVSPLVEIRESQGGG